MPPGYGLSELVAGLVANPWGQVTPSVYETGRLVSLAPYLPGHLSRVDYLVAWSTAPRDPSTVDGYGLVPLLSATEALLAEAHRDRSVIPAVRAGLAALFATGRVPGPDTPAIELIVPALVAALNERLRDPPPGLDPWRGADPLPLPAGFTAEPLAALHRAVRAGKPVPAKVLHSLEVLGPAAAGAPGAAPVPPGTVGASPAATAAWLGGAPDRSGYLASVVSVHSGPVPSVLPVTAFERAWVLAELAAAGLPRPPYLVAGLRAELGPDGTPGGAGLPPDADTTAVALVAVGARSVSSLWRFQDGTHFCAWPGERTASPTVNAHVLDALLLGGFRAPRGLPEWLAGQQRADGSWTDKWHASPYYATTACVRALSRLRTPLSTVAVAGAVAYVVGSQRADGSWGRWGGTAEETAYALLALRRVGGPPAVVARGDAYLRRAVAGPHPPLWHDKDLYRPIAVVDAAILSALSPAGRGTATHPTG